MPAPPSQEAAYPPAWRNLAARSSSGKQLQFLEPFCAAGRQALLPAWAESLGMPGCREHPAFLSASP